MQVPGSSDAGPASLFQEPAGDRFKCHEPEALAKLLVGDKGVCREFLVGVGNGEGALDQPVADIHRPLDFRGGRSTEDLATGRGQVVDIEFWVLVEYLSGQNDFHNAQGFRISRHGCNLNYSSPE